MLHLLYTHPDVQPWMLTDEAAAIVAGWLPVDVAVTYHRRQDLPRAWARAHAGARPPAVPPYAFRAWADRDRNQVNLLVDQTETPASAAWLVLHELAHVVVSGSPLLHAAFRDHADKPRRYLTDDHAHEAHPEEQLANHVATTLLPVLGYEGGELGRLWWRMRVCILRGRQAHGCPKAA